MTDARDADPQTARFQEKRNAIVQAAVLHFNAQGVKGATLAEIAASVGLVTHSLTYYYRKKEDLAAACFLRAIALFEEIAHEAAQAPTRAARVRAFIARHAQLLAAVRRGTHAPVVAFSDVRALPSPQLETVHAAYADMFRRVRALLQPDDGAAWPRETCHARTHMLLALVHWLPVWFERYEVAQYPRMAQRVADVALQGLGAPGTAWPENAPPAGWRAPGPPGAMDGFLRAATALVNEQGYRGASVDKISARLHLTKGAFYHHNDNKRDLISACFERTFDLVGQALAGAEAGGGDGWQQACAVVRALLEFQLGPDGPLLRLSSTSALPGAQDRARVLQSLQQLTERLAAMLVDGMVDGSIRPQDTQIAAQVLIGGINGAAELHRWVPGVDERSVLALYARPLLLGLLCAP